MEHPFETKLDWEEAKSNKEYRDRQQPGSIGVTRTWEHYMAYCVDENHRFTKCSTHNSWEEAYGMALRRYREFAQEPGYEKPNGLSFSYGPMSSNTGSEYDLVEDDMRKHGLREGFNCDIDNQFFKAQENWKRPSFSRYTVFIHKSEDDLNALESDPKKLKESIQEAIKPICDSVNNVKAEVISRSYFLKFSFDSEERLAVGGRQVLVPVSERLDALAKEQRESKDDLLDLNTALSNLEEETEAMTQ